MTDRSPTVHDVARHAGVSTATVSRALSDSAKLRPDTLDRVHWNRAKAARILQISYKALLYKIKDCGLTDPRITASIPDLPPVGLAAANDPLRSSS